MCIRDRYNGIPQGSVLSSTLFNVALHDTNKNLDRNIKMSYADDITVWTAHTDPCRANTNLQEAINEIATWTNKWGCLLYTSRCV